MAEFDEYEEFRSRAMSSGQIQRYPLVRNRSLIERLRKARAKRSVTPDERGESSRAKGSVEVQPLANRLAKLSFGDSFSDGGHSDNVKDVDSDDECSDGLVFENSTSPFPSVVHGDVLCPTARGPGALATCLLIEHTLPTAYPQHAIPQRHSESTQAHWRHMLSAYNYLWCIVETVSFTATSKRITGIRFRFLHTLLKYCLIFHLNPVHFWNSRTWLILRVIIQAHTSYYDFFWIL